jgi:hypothetical protein
LAVTQSRQPNSLLIIVDLHPAGSDTIALVRRCAVRFEADITLRAAVFLEAPHETAPAVGLPHPEAVLDGTTVLYT